MTERSSYVHVEKADLPLNSGESVHDFMRQLRDGVREHMRKKLKLADDSHVFPVDVFANTAVIEVSQFKKNKKPKHAFFSVSFKRKGPVMELGDPVDVFRRVTYEPLTTVAKRSSLWSGVL